jgi:hypothetical protein
MNQTGTDWLVNNTRVYVWWHKPFIHSIEKQRVRPLDKISQGFRQAFDNLTIQSSMETENATILNKFYSRISFFITKQIYIIQSSGILFYQFKKSYCCPLVRPRMAVHALRLAPACRPQRLTGTSQPNARGTLLPP